MSAALTASQLLFISQQFTIYAGFTIMFTGVIGHIINIIVLTSSKQIRHTPAAFYLIVESMVDIVQITIPMSARIAMNGFGVDLTRTSLIWCRLRQFIVSTSSLITFSLICFAALDQYFTTSYYPHIRGLSSIKLAHRVTLIAMIIWPLHGILFLTLNEIHPVLGCYAANPIFNAYSIYVYVLTLSGILPMVVSITLAILAYYNVRRIVRLQIAVFRRRLDRQLTAMILARVVFLTIVTVPFVVHRIYNLQAQISPTDVIHRAIVQLLGSITFQMSYLHSACPFYVYMAVSARYRRQVRYVLLKKYGRYWFKRGIPGDNQVAPISHVSSVEMD